MQAFVGSRGEQNGLGDRSRPGNDLSGFTAHWRREIVLRHRGRTADLSTRAPCRRWRT